MPPFVSMCTISNRTATSGSLLFKNFSNLFIPRRYLDYKNTEIVLETYVIPVICGIGLLGNALNVLVLSRRRLYRSFEQLERSAHTFFFALAISDMFFCISVIPQAFLDSKKFSSESVDFWLVYNTYSAAVINTFLLCSALLTVALAASRYVAVCHPLHARHSTATGKIVTAVVITSILMNLPRFWKEMITSIPCNEGGRSYFPVNGPLQQNITAHLVYMWLYFAFGIVGPLLILGYCNIKLIKVLQQSEQLRRQHSSNTVTCSRNMVTFTLCLIILFYIILVTPAEVLNFGKYFVRTKYSLIISMHYSLAVSICNMLQAVNFSFNFILYCIINNHFRTVALHLFSSVSCLFRGSCSKAGSTPLAIHGQEVIPLQGKPPCHVRM